ncbi:class I SAM-dependent methyltransferase [Nitrosarchaeum sp.]|uniref:class I SAM-dependent methyltransferase n=1 Tax=Nitrosarchaeum sp. TaxID=2026886 RepID=UPI00247E77B5|nr:class I SAM-dependent methyltransferase [Nitrosarchaeum sp.]MCV0411877.1 class I SAM-dependent methyltransferase [Nitrosarchaeum sp.]
MNLEKELDISAISKTVRRRIKEKIIGKSNYGNKEWKKADNEWYSQIHERNYLLHEDFIRYLKEKRDISTVLEIGCGTGIYPIKYKHLFKDLNYTGIDISQENIDYCKKQSNFQFICGDWIKMESIEKYDLIYSHAVVDHVYDIEQFISKICTQCKKYAYINAYRGYFPDLKKHKMSWRDDDGCYYNDISLIQLKETLLKQLKEDEFVIKPQENGTGIVQTVIKITKKLI